MIPKPGRAIADIADRLATRVLPELGSEFAQADAGLLAGLLGTLAQDYERAAYNLAADIEEIKAIFHGAPDHPARAAYRSGEPRSIRIPDLTTYHADGLDLLIELHAWAETNDAALDRLIWDFLRRSSERHKLEVDVG